MLAVKIKPLLFPVVVAVLVLLLPLLAYLQYDWLGKVSEREREQMQSTLRRALSQFRQQFDREITRIFLQFQQRPDRWEQSAEDYAAVQDLGAGIASSDLTHIFEPFYRGRLSIENQIQGSGLGLSLVKKIVDAHRGQIDVNIFVNFRSTEVFRSGQPLKLSAREFKLLRYFIENLGVTLSRDELLNAVWGYDAIVFTRTVDVHVAWLRRKIEPDPRHPEYIRTIHGYGYRFVV